MTDHLRERIHKLEMEWRGIGVLEFHCRWELEYDFGGK